MKHIKILTKWGLSENDGAKQDVLAYCSPDSIDECSSVDEVHCQAVATDYCDVDKEDGACMFNSFDKCYDEDYSGCGFYSTDICNTDYSSCNYHGYDYCGYDG